MSKFIEPIGECCITGKKQYSTISDCQQVCDWANKQNAQKGNPIRVTPEHCSVCGYWHIVTVKQTNSVSDVDEFIEKPREMTIEEMIQKLGEEGYWVIEPKNVEKAARRLKFVKELLEAEKENA